MSLLIRRLIYLGLEFPDVGRPLSLAIRAAGYISFCWTPRRWSDKVDLDGRDGRNDRDGPARGVALWRLEDLNWGSGRDSISVGAWPPVACGTFGRGWLAYGAMRGVAGMSWRISGCKQDGKLSRLGLDRLECDCRVVYLQWAQNTLDDRWVTSMHEELERAEIGVIKIDCHRPRRAML